MELAKNISWVLDCIPRKFKIENAPYSLLKINSYKTGYNGKAFEKVINTLAKFNKPLLDRIELRKETKELVYYPEQPICYEILYTKDKIQYCYAIPTMYKSVFLNKLRFLLDKSDIIEVEDYTKDFVNCYKQSYKYKNNWIFSLNNDDGVNISDSLIVLHKDIQHEDDKILVQYVMQPMFDYQWADKWQTNYDKYATTGNIQNYNNIFEIIDKLGDFVLYHLDLMMNAVTLVICGEEAVNAKKEKENFAKDLSTNSKHKGVFDGFNTNVNLYIKSNSNLTIQNVSRNAQTIFQDLNGDNSLKCGKAKVVNQITRQIKGGYIMNTQEVKQLVKTPSESMLKQYEDIVDTVNIAELDIPKDLFEKGVQLGEMYKGSTSKPFYTGSDADSNSKPMMFIAPQGAGKTTLNINYAIGCIEHGDGVFLFDTIDGKTKDHVKSFIDKKYPEEKIIVLDYASDEFILPLEWGEIIDFYMKKIKKEENYLIKFKIMEEFSGIMASHLRTFVDTIQIESREQMLTPLMSKMLCDVAQLVFMNEGNLGMVRECLHDKKLRHKLLNNLNLPTQIPFVRDIFKIDDEPDNSQTIRGIESRLNVLMDNQVMKKLFSIKKGKEKIDFAKWANEGYCVIINVPESRFGSNVNSIVTFLVQKLWLAVTSSRYDIPEDKRKQCHLLIDEFNKFPNIVLLLTDNIIASRKWRLKYVFYIHSVDIFGRMFENLRSAGVSILMMPTSMYNFSKVSEFYSPYTYDELKEVEKLNAKHSRSRFALVSWHHKNVNYPMVLKLLPPIETKRKKIDRSNLDSLCAARYGVKQTDYYEELFKEPMMIKGKGIDKDKVCI